MKAVIQRVSEASVSVEGKMTGEIGQGLVVLLAVEKGDGEGEVQFMADKLIGLRCFNDDNNKMNLSIKDVGGEMLVISQFTLAASLEKGRRPSFERAERPDAAELLYTLFVETVRASGFKVATGIFGAMMDVRLINQGPVTFALDSPHS
ncbi:D-aminoacyl-tRNA deacylase [Acidobacteriota bacterium]